MPRRKKTLRRMMPTTRKLARLLDELDSVHRRLNNLLPTIERHELDARALWQQQHHIGEGE